MLTRNFESTNKFLAEKNTALEMIYKIKKRRKQESEHNKGEGFGEDELEEEDQGEAAADQDHDDDSENGGGDELDDMLELNDAPVKDDEHTGLMGKS